MKAFEPYAARTHEMMRDVLHDAGAPGPAIHYYMIRGGKDKRNITVMEPGVVGREYIKTYGHYHVGALEETYWFVHGEGVVLMQKRVDEQKPEMLEAFRAIRVKAGDSVRMPAGFAHLMVNIGKTWLVMVDDSPVDGVDDSASRPGHADYEPVKQMHGFAYYVVEQGGAPALIRNTRYIDVGSVDLGGMPALE